MLFKQNRLAVLLPVSKGKCKFVLNPFKIHFGSNFSHISLHKYWSSGVKKAIFADFMEEMRI